MFDQRHLLTSKEVAQFITFGFLRFDEIVPEEINKRCLGELRSGVKGAACGVPLEGVYSADSAIGEMLALPKVQGILCSLVGQQPVFDHHYLHVRKPMERRSQPLHADGSLAEDDTLTVQLSYYPHDVAIGNGGTLLIPGSQFRRVCGSDIARYQNFLGQQPIVCKAGSIFAFYYGIWHAGRPNITDQPRLMFKIRFKPSTPDSMCWNRDDIDDPSVKRILNTRFPWHDGTSVKQDLKIRITKWLKMSGQSLQLMDALVDRPVDTIPLGWEA